MGISLDAMDDWPRWATSPCGAREGVAHCDYREQVGNEADHYAVFLDLRMAVRLTPNVEFSGGAPLYGAASAGTKGSASPGPEKG